ncbi:MAG: hypothetical protein AABY22_11885 [Nanoarchaeota archaeon]
MRKVLIKILVTEKNIGKLQNDCNVIFIEYDIITGYYKNNIFFLHSYKTNPAITNQSNEYFEWYKNNILINKTGPFIKRTTCKNTYSAWTNKNVDNYGDEEVYWNE